MSNMSDYEGLSCKYIVTKADTGEDVSDCFVLRPTKDKAAVEAIRAYAAASENKILSADLLRWISSLPSFPKTNGDRIRSKTDYELAEFLAEIMDNCYDSARFCECSEECPMYECCNNQGSDNIEDWLGEEATWEVF